mgnify:CR=1 FL=1
MEIRNGLFPHMVLQRTAQNVSRAVIEGTSTLSGAVETRVMVGNASLAGLDWERIGSARRGRFAAILKGVPTGGPYTVELRVRTQAGDVEAAAAVPNVLVGDVWVLAGQSNMEGVGWLAHALKPVSSVRAFYMDDTWGIARDPVHNLWCAYAPVHKADPTTPRLSKDRRWSVGPGVSFGQAMHAATSVPQGLIACAHGGTTMEQWDPAKKARGGESLYGAMCDRVRKNGGRVRGVLWYQGCSDANPDAVAHYSARMKRLVAAMRRDFSDKRLPVAMAQIGRFFFGAGDGQWWNAIQELQRRLPQSIARLAVVPTVDLPMDDGIHLGGDGQNILGRRLAQAMRVLLDGARAGMLPIDVDRITADLDIRRFLYTVTVSFRNVEGCLQSKDAPWGFNHAGTPNKVFRTTLAGASAELMVSGVESEMREKGLSYGHGFQPFCNITDSAGRPLPVFGPLPIDMSPIARWLPVTACQAVIREMDDAAIRTMPCPGDWRGACDIAGPKCDSFTPLSAWTKLDVPVRGVACYRVRYAVPSARTIRLHLGYDGPLKVWHDGKPLFVDMKGCRPAMPDDALRSIRVTKGTHELVVALGARGGWTTGVFLTLEDNLAASRRISLVR